MTESLPETAVVRLSRGSFDPSLFAEVEALNLKQAEYLVPAIKALPGLISWYASLMSDGMVQVSIWDSYEHAKQMDTLKEMNVIARGEMEALGVKFVPIVNPQITWTI
ncbi:hypothetical protein [Catenulispora pinisilvae]|uniref:hypothetical protein n=1 Tax=Catenulispora pinisilvae TaxID=2705253 RepID=UPI001891A99A|nr:hypothetical protein [Catenulispora pinisilvae]